MLPPLPPVRLVAFDRVPEAEPVFEVPVFVVSNSVVNVSLASMIAKPLIVTLPGEAVIIWVPHLLIVGQVRTVMVVAEGQVKT